MKKVIIGFMMLVFGSINSQNFIYLGNDSYHSTSSWRFEMNGEYWKGQPELTFAKNGSEGFMLLNIETPYPSHYIKGDLYLFLNNGKILKCNQTGNRDYLDNSSFVAYKVSEDKVNLLRRYKIDKIRFSIYNENDNSSSDFSANNKKHAISWLGNKELNYWETDKEIESLLNKQ